MPLSSFQQRLASEIVDAKNDWMNCFLQDNFPKSDAFHLLHMLWKTMPHVEGSPVGLAAPQQCGPKLQ